MDDSETAANDEGARQRSLTSSSGGQSDAGSVTKDTTADDRSEVTSKSDDANQGDKVEVPRTIGLIGGVSFIVGTIIGSGIFISPKGVAEGSGSVAFCLINWTICGIISMLGALCYAEMGTVVKESGADYALLQAAFGPILSYMFAWVFSLLIKPADIATKTLTCAQYILVALFDDGCGDAPLIDKKLLAITVLMILASINVYSIKLSARIQIIFTVTKLIALAIIIIGGIVMLIQGKTEYLATGFEGTETNIGAIALGYYSGMFAYDGWTAANFITEEIKRPERNLPLSIIIGVPLVTLAYVMTNVSYFTVMSIQDVISSSAVAITWASYVLPAVPWLMPIFVAMSTFGSSNGSLFASGRLMFVAARNEHLPVVLGMVNVKNYTPVLANILTSVIAALFMMFMDVSSLIKFVSFLKWLFYGINMISFMVLRFHKKYRDVSRPVKVPIITPIIVFLAAIFIVVVPIIVDPQIEFIFAAIFIAIGYVFYVPFVHFKIRLRFMDYITTFFQLYLQMARTTQNS